MTCTSKYERPNFLFGDVVVLKPPYIPGYCYHSFTQVICYGSYFLLLTVYSLLNYNQ